MYGYGEFLGGDKQWRDEMAELLMVLAPRGTTIENINDLLNFIESHDTYLNIGEHNRNHTRDLTDHDLIYLYKKIRTLYKNTLVYTRPNDPDNAYCRNVDKLSFDDVYKLDEREHFNRVYLDSKEIKEANKIKTLKPSYKKH